MQRGGQIFSAIVDVQHAPAGRRGGAVRFVQTKKAHRQNVSGFAQRDEAAPQSAIKARTAAVGANPLRPGLLVASENACNSRDGFRGYDTAEDGYAIVEKRGQSARALLQLQGRAQCESALTIESVTFLASPNSIIVLSRKNSSFSTPA